MNGPRDCLTESEKEKHKLEKEKHCDEVSYVWIQKNDTNELTYNTSARLTDLENRLLVGGRMGVRYC